MYEDEHVPQCVFCQVFSSIFHWNPKLTGCKLSLAGGLKLALLAISQICIIRYSGSLASFLAQVVGDQLPTLFESLIFEFILQNPWVFPKNRKM